VLLGTLLIGGLVLQALDIIDPIALLTQARHYADTPWLIAALIVWQIVLFTFALPGSTTLWLVAPLYPPLTAGLILVLGGTGGGVSAYFFARHLGSDWQARIRHQRVFQRMEQRGDMLTLLGLRILPGFPHSAINYGAGLLRLPLRQFVLTTALGLAVKSAIYCPVIYRAAGTDIRHFKLSIQEILPLLLLALGLVILSLYLHTRDRLKEKNH